MVDEYQDTNYIQEQFVLMLADEQKNVCVVGDDDQGLYRFRGATIRNILQFKENFPGDTCKQIYLTENYRSEEQIITFYNAWMETTSGRGFKFDWGKFRFPKTIIGKKKNINKGTTVVRCSASRSYDAWHAEIFAFITNLKENGILSDYNQIAFLCKSVKNGNAHRQNRKQRKQQHKRRGERIARPFALHLFKNFGKIRFFHLLFLLTTAQIRSV